MLSLFNVNTYKIIVPISSDKKILLNNFSLYLEIQGLPLLVYVMISFTISFSFSFSFFVLLNENPLTLGECHIKIIFSYSEPTRLIKSVVIICWITTRLIKSVVIFRSYCGHFCFFIKTMLSFFAMLDHIIYNIYIYIYMHSHQVVHMLPYSLVLRANKQYKAIIGSSTYLLVSYFQYLPI